MSGKRLSSFSTKKYDTNRGYKGLALSVKFSTDIFQKTGFEISCKLSPEWRQFAWNVRTCFLGKIENIINLLSAELAQRSRVVKAKPQLKQQNKPESNLMLFLLLHENVLTGFLFLVPHFWQLPTEYFSGYTPILSGANVYYLFYWVLE